MATENARIVLETSKGSITLELDTVAAPVTAENFVRYVEDKFYDGTIFHRVIPGFMIQGGGFEANMKQKATKAPIANESKNGLANARGTIAMARTNDPNSATAQFFINLSDNEFLNYQGAANVGYAVFGKVVEGMDIADAIVGVKTGSSGGHQDVPVEAVVINSATLVS